MANSFNEWFNGVCERLEREQKEREIADCARILAITIKEFEKQGLSEETAIEILKALYKKAE